MPLDQIRPGIILGQVTKNLGLQTLGKIEVTLPLVLTTIGKDN